MYAGEHATQKLREEYLAAVLRQNIAFFDKLGAGEITSTITANMDIVQVGISEKVALCITALSTFVAALIVGFVKNWRLSLVLLSVVAAVILIMGSCSVFIVKYSKLSLDAYSVGGAIVEEAISSIRTTTAFNSQEKLSNKYKNSLVKSMHWGFRMKVSIGCMVSSMMCVTYLDYGLSFWEGSRLLVDGHSNLSNTLTVLLSMLLAAVSVAHAAPHVRAFGEGVAAAANIFKLIDRPLPSANTSGLLVPGDIQGALEFRNIKHIYPSRPEITVLEDFNLVVPAGKITALVGVSGSGKSTIVDLVEKFYTPVRGQVLLDNQDIQTLDTKWIRRQMSLVTQEPLLFNCSIRTNIEHGLIGTDLENISTEKRNELVIEASKMANAYDFINRLPKKYETVVGDRGILLSGGQKQRIAIARAIISNPKILLLDEATSALDSRSEQVVQAALDIAAKGRTTIAVAHRLSTIRGADNIVVLSKGKIAEQGTHDELISMRGLYFNLVEAQRLSAQNGSADESREDGDTTSPPTKGATGRYGAKELSPRDTSIVDTTLHSQQSEDTHYSLWTVIKFITAFNKQESGIMLLGLIFSIIAGGGMPVQGLLFAKCTISLSHTASEYSELRSDVNYWSLMFLIVALVVWIVSTGHGIAFAYCSECLYAFYLLPTRCIFH